MFEKIYSCPATISTCRSARLQMSAGFICGAARGTRTIAAVWLLCRARHNRHSTAMTILTATRDIRKVSLWLGHADIKTTEMYLRASPADKLEILEAVTPPSINPGKFPRARDELMEILYRT